MGDGTGLAEAILGLDGVVVLDVDETAAEVVITVETTATIAGCATCGAVAEAHDRMRVDVRDLPCFGRPARLVWMKRRWRCREVDCPQKTWTEQMPGAVPPRAVLTVRAGMEVTRLVGELALPVATVARELGVCWWMAMDAVITHGRPLVDDPERVGPVRALGIDETNYQSAKPTHPTLYATGMVDLDRRIVSTSCRGTPRKTCAGGVRPRTRRGFGRSRWSPPISPSTTGPG